ncbi:uncharacterized protein LAJ45_03986 [Morchella importuna]|uniref:uncharacterized protein n=1 Tax=Morchella importuna TaxID=1174673 RepID=UPI001E8DD471|nr:uncharacterized protein LAJ45_03986 [Morchella importuna]KAH8151993.1 hypothetical protein LAJ45_03986 [Morchella importuna]
MAPTKKSAKSSSSSTAPRKIDVYNSTSTGHQVGDGVSKPAAYQRYRAAKLQAQFGQGGAGGGSGAGGQAKLWRYLASAKAAGTGKQKMVLETVVNSRDATVTARDTTTTSSKDTTKTTVSRDTATTKDITTATASSKDTTPTAISRDTAATGDTATAKDTIKDTATATGSPATATGSLKTSKAEEKAPATSPTTARDITRDTATTTTTQSPKPPKEEEEEKAVIDTSSTTTTPATTTISPKTKTKTKTPKAEDTTTPTPTTTAPPPPPKQFFHPLTIHISGATTPHISDHALKHLLARHGARIAPSIAQRSTTHVIIGGGAGAGGLLAAGKLQKEVARRRGNVRALDSVKAGRRLPEGRYAVGVKARGQRSVGEVFAVKKDLEAEGSGGRDLEDKEAEGSAEKP